MVFEEFENEHNEDFSIDFYLILLEMCYQLDQYDYFQDLMFYLIEEKKVLDPGACTTEQNEKILQLLQSCFPLSHDEVNQIPIFDRNKWEATYLHQPLLSHAILQNKDQISVDILDFLMRQSWDRGLARYFPSNDALHPGFFHPLKTALSKGNVLLFADMMDVLHIESDDPRHNEKGMRAIQAVAPEYNGLSHLDVYYQGNLAGYVSKLQRDCEQNGDAEAAGFLQSLIEKLQEHFQLIVAEPQIQEPVNAFPQELEGAEDGNPGEPDNNFYCEEDDSIDGASECSDSSDDEPILQNHRPK